MRKIVDQVMSSSNAASPLPQTELREKVSCYVELLCSAGKRDPEELVALGGNIFARSWKVLIRVFRAADLKPECLLDLA